MLLSRGGKFLTCPGVTCGCCVLQLDAVGLLGHLSQAVGGAVDMGVAPLFAGPYKLRFSLWGFTWNKGRIEPAPSLQYATVWPTPDISNTLSKSVGVMTAPSLEPHEQEITTWLEPRELLVFDPVSVHSRFLGDHKQEMVVRKRGRSSFPTHGRR